MGEKVEGQAAWIKTGIEMSPEEAKELTALKEKLKRGETLTYAESNRLFVLKQKQKAVPHVE